MLRNLKRPFYGWYIVAAAIVFQAMPSGLINQSFGTYVVLLERDFGWNRATLSGAFAVMRVEDGLLGPIEGWLLDRFGPRVVMRVGTVLFAAGLFMFSRVESVFDFYVAFMIIAVGTSLAGFLALTTAVVNWFERKRSVAMGIALLGGASGGLLLPVVVGALEEWGWRAVARASALIVLAIGLPVVQIIRRRPQDYGMYPDGMPPEAPAVSADGSAAPSGQEAGEFTAGQALRTRAFWFISLAHASSVLVVSVITVHFTPHAVAMGFSLAEAALVITIQTVANLASRPTGGWLSDQIGSRAVLLMAMLGHAIALLLLAFAMNFWMLAGFALLNGLAWGARVPVSVAMRAEYFGAKSFGTIMGLSSVVVTASSVAAPVAAGWSYDVLGSYTLSFTVLAVLAGVGSLFVVFTPPPVRPRQRGRRNEVTAAH